MSGLFGAVGNFELKSLDMLLAGMAGVMKHEAWYRVDLYRDQDFGAGRASTGLSNPEEQPVWNEEKTLCIFMEGEIFGHDEEKRKLIEAGHQFQGDSQAEFILHLYEEHGENFISNLNGAFVVAIWDRSIRKLVLTNDRIGLQPIYYAHRNGNLIFASNVGALLADPDISKQVDSVAIAQLLTFDHVLDDRTLLEEARLLRPATLLTFHNQQLSLRRYWRPRYPESYELYSEQACIEELTHYLKQAFTRQASTDISSGILLSGGLDSRLVLALLGENLPDGRLHTFTFGIPGCDDARFAGEATSRTRARHHFFELKSDYLLEAADKGVRLTDGLQNCVHMHALATVIEETQHAKIIYKGFMGDALMGYGMTRSLWSNYPDDELTEAHYQAYAEVGGILFDRFEQQELFTDGFHRQVEERLNQSYRDAIDESGSKLFADQRNYFDLCQRVPRMTLQGVQLVRSQAVVRLPYCDNDLVDFMLSIPPGMRFERYLMKKAFTQRYPELAKIPYTETNMPMIFCARELLIRTNYQIRWHLRNAGLKWIPLPRKRPYADYNKWMRTDLSSWIKATLLSKKSLSRGYFNPDYVRQIVDEHMAGANHSRKLGMLLSLELWHNIYLD
jgi:asparagine synthase (glutamine-hydrolysing)